MSCGCLCRVPWSQILSREWRCSWSSADRRLILEVLRLLYALSGAWWRQAWKHTSPHSQYLCDEKPSFSSSFHSANNEERVSMSWNSDSHYISHINVSSWKSRHPCHLKTETFKQPESSIEPGSLVSQSFHDTTSPVDDHRHPPSRLRPNQNKTKGFWSCNVPRKPINRRGYIEKVPGPVSISRGSFRVW